MKPFIKKSLLGLLITMGVFASTTVFALQYVPLTTIPGVSKEAEKLKNPSNLISGIYTASIGIGAILAVIMIITGGIKYTVVESFGGKTNAKKQIQAALFGLVLLLGSYLILATINKDLVNINITLPQGGGNLETLSAEQADAAARVSAINREYNEALRVIAIIEKEANDLKTQKDSLQKDYDLLADKNSQQAKDLQAQIAQLDTQYTEKINRATTLRNEADTIRITGATAVASKQLIDSLNSKDYFKAASALHKLGEAEQQKIDLLKKQNQPQDVIKKAEGNKIYEVTKGSLTLDTAKALDEIQSNYFTNRPQVFILRDKIKTDAEQAFLTLTQTDPSKVVQIQAALAENTKKINDALVKKYGCPAGSTTVLSVGINGAQCR